MDEVKIQSTKNYKRFTLHEKNRKLNMSKINKLAKAIGENNLMHIFPIIVNKKNEILDGQHRFEAAKLVKATLFFVVSNGNYDIDKVAETNSLQSHWKVADYVNYYAKEGRAPYLKALELCKKYDVDFNRVGNLSGIANTMALIKSRKFEFADYQDIVKILKHARLIGIEFGFKYWNSRAFLRAIRHLLSVKKYNELRMMQKLKAHPDRLIKLSEAEHYIKMLEEVYNTGAIEQVRFL